MLCPWWLLKAGQCCLRLFILKSFPHSFFPLPPPPSKIHTCARDVTSLGTIKWISALIAWLMGFAATITWKESQLIPGKEERFFFL